MLHIKATISYCYLKDLKVIFFVKITNHQNKVLRNMRIQETLKKEHCEKKILQSKN